MPELLINGSRLHYEETGIGEPLILLHGLGADSTMFRYEAEALKPYFRVIMPDSRGHGQSDKPASFTLDDHVRDVLGLMDQLNLGRVHLLGISMGSYIAQGVAAAAPERIGKLVLIVSKAYGSTSSTQELLNRYADELKGLTADEQLNAVSKYTFRNLKAIGRWRQELDGVQTTLTPEEQKAASRALDKFDFRPVLPSITAPTLVISGKYDGLNPPERGRELASLIPDAVYIEFDESGHAPNVEERERYLELISDFLLND